MIILLVDNITRHEVKYFLDVGVYERLLSDLLPFIHENKYSNQEVHNIYYDNDHDEMILRSMEKQEFKEKLRARVYAMNGVKSDVFVEIKKKYQGISYKRRTSVTYDDFIEKGINAVCKESQIGKEIHYLYNRTKSYQKVYIGCMRKSFRAIKENDLRFTFDSGIRVRTCKLDFGFDDCDRELVKDGQYILEIKSEEMGFPLWLVQILSKHKLYAISFSKYGVSYTCGLC